jgi:hypothetical protein
LAAQKYPQKAAREEKPKDKRPSAQNRITINTQDEIDAMADLIIRRERNRQPGNAASTELRRSA